MKQILIVSIAIACGITIALSAGTLKVKRTDPLVWFPIDAKVDEGVIHVTATYTHLPPCDMLFQMFNVSDKLTEAKRDYPNLNDSNMTLYERAINRLYCNCRRTYEEVWTPIWNSANNRTLIRHKRFIDPISISIIAVSLIAAAGAIIACETRYVQIPAIREELEISRKFMQKHQNIDSIIEKLEQRIVEQLNREVYSLRQAVLLGVDVSWAATVIHNKILRETDNLEELISSSKQGGKVPLSILSKLLRAPWLDNFDERHATWVHLNRISESTMEIAFNLKNTSPNVTVLKAQPFVVYNNFTRFGASQLIYDGPAYAIFNQTNNCSVGVEQPVDGLVSAECLIDNYSDPAFQRWRPGLNKTKLVDLRPQVKKNRKSVILYCPMNKYIVDEMERQCPHYPFTLPPRTSFRAKGVRHEVSYKNITATDESFFYAFPPVNESVQEGMKVPDLDDLLQDLHESNLESAELVQKMDNYFMVPTNGWLAYLTGFLVATPWAIPLVLLLIYLAKRRSQSTGATITVNTLNSTNDDTNFEKVLEQFNK